MTNINEFINNNPFPNSRLNHCYGVAKKMYLYAKEILGWNEDKAREMYYLGLLHDAGYEFESSVEEHDDISYKILNGYKYAREIKEHSILTKEYQSDELDLLYYADATVDGNGYACTFEERLHDLKNRHGENSKIYKDSKDIAEYLIEKGFR